MKRGIRSLAYATDIAALGDEAVIDRREGYIRVATPSAPSFHWGNFLLFDDAPTEDAVSIWPQIFAEEFRGFPDIAHVALGWDDTVGDRGAADTFIEKDSSINSEVERLRHSATNSLLTRRDVVVVATVSCIYGLGLPEDYARGVITLSKGEIIQRRKLLTRLEAVQFVRNDIELKRGRYRVTGDTIDVHPSAEENWVRLSFFGDELEAIYIIHPVSGEIIEEKNDNIFMNIPNFGQICLN